MDELTPEEIEAVRELLKRKDGIIAYDENRKFAMRLFTFVRSAGIIIIGFASGSVLLIEHGKTIASWFR